MRAADDSREPMMILRIRNSRARFQLFTRADHRKLFTLFMIIIIVIQSRTCVRRRGVGGEVFFFSRKRTA